MKENPIVTIGSRFLPFKWFHPLTHEVPVRCRAAEEGVCRIANSIALKKLLAQLELLRDRLVPIAIGRMQVIEQAAPLANHDQQASA